jgi:hypothetical protein
MESAKRRAPVARPVVAKGIRYDQMRRPEEHGFTQSGGVIAAVDTKTDKILWSVQLYKTDFDGAEEGRAGGLREGGRARQVGACAAGDRKRVRSVDPATHAVTRVGGAARS